MNQAVWLHQPCPCSPPYYPALFSSFSDSMWPPSLFPHTSPAPFSSLPMVFPVWLPFAKPFSLLVLLITLCRNLAFCCFVWIAVVFHLSLFLQGYHKDHLSDCRRELCSQWGGNYPAWVSPYQAPIAGQERELSQWEVENLSYFTRNPSAYFQRALPCIAYSHVSFWYSHFPPHILFYLHIKAVCGASSFWAVITVAGELTPQASICCFDHGF